MVDITVADTLRLPDNAYLSIRVGEVRRQMQVKPGSRYRFVGDTAPTHFHMEVFEKVGSVQVSLKDLVSVGDGGGAEGDVAVPKASGLPMSFRLKVQVLGTQAARDAKKAQALPDTKAAGKAVRQQAAVKAKNYLDEHSVQKLLQGMVHHLLEQQPDDPVHFMTNFLQDHEVRGQQKVVDLGSLKEQQGCPEESVAQPQPLRQSVYDTGFPVDGSRPLPDLSGHHSLAAAVLREQPSLYVRLKDRSTASGGTLMHCIKTAIDNQGHPRIKSLGLVAADDACYDLFKEIFDPVIEQWHQVTDLQDQPSDRDPAKLADEEIHANDPHVHYVYVSALRNIKGRPMAPACSVAGRREVERLLARAFLRLQGDLAGRYLPARASTSYVPSPRGMTADEEQRLCAQGLCLEEPDSSVAIASGFAHHWPDARGVFTASAEGLWVRVNEADHLRIDVRRADGDWRAAFDRLVRAESALAAELHADGHTFAQHKHWGFLTACPSNVGTAMIAGAVLRIPLLAKVRGFYNLCVGLHMSVKMHVPADGAQRQDVRGALWDVSGTERLGLSEVDQLIHALDACQFLIYLERRLEGGETLDLQDELQQWQSGADAGSHCSGFPVDECPDALPDLTQHNSIMADVFKRDPGMYHRLKGKRTSRHGVSLAQCIKPGIDNEGHAMVKRMGLVACDAECYDEFRELFDAAICQRHGPSCHAGQYQSDLDFSKIADGPADPSGRRARLACVVLTRNFMELRMPSACPQQERREVERVLTRVFFTRFTQDALKGEYRPLPGSSSYLPRPTGMSKKEEEELRKLGFLFVEPDSVEATSSGLARQWPDARGVFVTSDQQLAIWANEEDHVKVICRNPSGDLKSAFERATTALRAVEQGIESAGYRFARNDRWGFLSAMPSHIGACMVATLTMSLPAVLAKKTHQAEFRSLCQRLGVQAAPVSKASLAALGTAAPPSPKAAPGHLVDVRVAGRINASEVVQLNCLLNACCCFAEVDARLESGEAVKLGSLGTVWMSPCPKHEFPEDECPSSLPDLGDASSVMADVLRRDPCIYHSLRRARTASGVTFAKCIKPGMDAKGQKLVKPVGAIAGDGESFSTFQRFFRPLLAALHPAWTQGVLHRTDHDWRKVHAEPVVPSGRVCGVRVSLRRNLSGFRMLPSCSAEERREVERLLLTALEGLSGDLSGEYFPLVGSTSYAPKPAGMTPAERSELLAQALLFKEQEGVLAVSAGYNKEWPDARGVFKADDRCRFSAWINEEDHLRLLSFRPQGDLREAFRLLSEAEAAITATLGQLGFRFATSRDLGYLTACPSNVGTALRAVVSLRLPLLRAQRGFEQLCTSLRLGACAASEGVEVWNLESLGSSEAEQLNAVHAGVRRLVELEAKLERGENVQLAS